MAVDPDCAHKSLDECHHSDDFITDENIDRRIKTLSCGLAEIVPSADWLDGCVVQFIHQSVHDFFTEHGLLLLDQTGKTDLVGSVAHCRLSRSCIRYFKMAVVSQSGPLDRQDKARLPMLHYATTSWVSHVKLGEPAETSANDILDRIRWPVEPFIKAWVEIYEEMAPYSFWCPSHGSSLVHIVSRYGLTKLLSCLLHTGKVDVDSKDKTGRTPLSWAAETGHDAVVKMFLDTGKVDIDARDTEYGRTPLWEAAGNGHEAVVKILLDTGKVDIDVRDTNYGRTPLLWASEKGQEAVVRTLLDTGRVDVDARDTKYGQTPLSLAAGNGHEAMVRILLDTGKVDADARDTEYGRTPLLWAAENGHEAVVKVLLDTGKVDIDIRDTNYGQTPLLWAAKCGHEAVVKVLLGTSKGDVNLKDEDR